MASRPLVLLYRQEIVGGTLVELARDAGISVDGQNLDVAPV